MRSPIGPVLILLGLATTVVLVLVLFQTIALRGDLERARDEITVLQARADTIEPGVSARELQRALDALEGDISDMLEAIRGDGDNDPSPPADRRVLDRLDEILEGIEGLEERIDEICDGVPIC